MTELIVIAAVARNRVIGNGLKIPWRISEDGRRFKQLTMGHPCIMGDVTYRSLPRKWRPLPGRENIVLTFDREFRPEGTTIMYDFDAAIAYVKQKRAPSAFIAGGASVYQLGLEVADTLELTEIHRDYPGDILFPKWNADEWELAERVDRHSEDTLSQQLVSYSFLTYRRK
jgi:dihydrofolate reductase